MLSRDFLERFQIANLMRVDEAFAPLKSWTPCDWIACLQGEIGEAINKAKKIKRVESGLGDINSDELMARLRHDLGEELADCFVYAMLIAHQWRIHSFTVSGCLQGVDNNSNLEYYRKTAGSGFNGFMRLSIVCNSMFEYESNGGCYRDSREDYVSEVIVWITVLAEHHGIDFETAIIEKFNETSSKSGSKIFL
jgi:NTP pyrophosphatase (non-canonical NTP hydrolase)